MAKLARRKMEGISLYRPFPAAEAFHECGAKWRILDGSNRAGKTLAAAAEAVRAWLGCDPHDKYIRAGGKSLVIGLDGDHIAQMWSKCALPGAFKIIPDEHSGLMRAVRPSKDDPAVLDPYDDAYREKWRDAPPLIPPRMITGQVAWDDKAKGIPRYVRFATGWRVLFRSSEGKSPQGENYHLGWIDEQIANEQFYLELVRGLVALGESHRHAPKGIWSATPQTCNLQLYELREKADRMEGDIAAFQLLIKDNPIIPESEKLEFYYSLPEDEREVRYNGIYAVDLQRIYGDYDPAGIHGVEPFDVPPTWSRVLVLDPGRQCCGTIMAAVDPEEKHIWVYDAFEHKGGDAESWAQVIREKYDGIKFDSIVIDQQMGRQHPPGSGKNVAEQYAGALKAVGIEPLAPGPLGGFHRGSNDVDAREKSLLTLLSVRAHGLFSGTPTLQIFKGICPELDRQIRRAQSDPKTGKRAKQKEDLLVCLEYLAAFGPVYRPPVDEAAPSRHAVWEAFQAKRRRLQQHAPNVNPGVSM